MLSDFQRGFIKSSRSTADLLIELLGLLTGLGLLELVHLIYPYSTWYRLLKGFIMLVFFTNLSLMEFQVGYLALFRLFLCRRLQVVLDGKSSHKYPVNAEVPQGSIRGPTLFLLYINDLPDDIICNIAIYANDTTLYSKCDQVTDDLWQQLDTVDWHRKWLVDFKAGKSQPVLFDRFNNTSAIDVRIDESVLEKKSSFKMLGLTLSKLDWGSCIISIAKLPPKKLEPWFVLRNSFLLRLLCRSINLRYAHEWNVVVICGLVLLAATWNC